MCTLKHAFNAKDMNSLVYKILKGKVSVLLSRVGSSEVIVVRYCSKLQF